jgi:hypothetical protein
LPCSTWSIVFSASGGEPEQEIQHMSEGHIEQRPGEGAFSGEPEASAPPAADPPRPRSPSWRTALWLAALLVLIVAGVALCPFWAPDVATLLPWGTKPAVSAEEYAVLAARVASIEKRPAPASADGDIVKSAITTLTGRVDRLQAGIDTRLAEIEKRPAVPGIDVDAIKSAQSALGHRVDELEATRNADRQIEIAVAATKVALQQLEERVGGLEAQSSSRAASAAAELQKMQQELPRLGSAIADFAQRLPAIERQVQAQSGSERRDAVLALLLLQMREALEQARPFPAEYNAFRGLTRDPELSAAVEPLADAARNGMADRAVLSKRLAEIAGRVATAPEPAADPDWGAQTLSRIRGLVTIRRIDGPLQTGPEAAVSAAQSALTRGDLAGAVAALEPLSGANAAAAHPWMQMARERLSAERALDHLQELLTARLSNSPAAPVPTGAPAEPAAPKTPS